MDPNTRALLMGASGGATEKIYVEDVFSTWLYTGNGSTRTITNGIDLSGKGGLVWIKHKSGAAYNIAHALFDTARTAGYELSSSNTGAQFNRTDTLTSFGSSGFSLGADAFETVNANSYNYASWTFRKAAKFFDVVSYTGSGANRTIAHNLGSVPGCIIVKRTDTTGDWQVYHRSLANTEYMVLNSTAAKATGTTRWNSTTPTSTEFSLGTDTTVNANGGTYVAYLFAHDAGGFGDSGNESVIKCGSYTGNGSTTGPVINLGWEPQWVMVKNTTGSVDDWDIFDNMRGVLTEGNDQRLRANLSNAEDVVNFIDFNATGFQPRTTVSDVNANGSTYIYIAIRRGPMKTPTDATKVFANNAITPSTSTFTTNFPVDFTLYSRRSGNVVGVAQDRLRGYPSVALTSGNYPRLETTATSAESFWYPDNPYMYGADSNTGIKYGTILDSVSSIVHAFRRAPGFFDVVCYTGTGSARTVTHNLGVAPELMIAKVRSGTTAAWGVYVNALGATKNLELNSTSAEQPYGSNLWNSTAPTSAVFSVNDSSWTNGSGYTYIAYLFASCPGVSKVGSYTGTGTTLSVDCGFTNGARFVLIKRTDSTGDWYVWDTARGIIANDDPYLLLNSTAAEVTNTDFIDPLSSGFQISSTAPAAINANGGSYIFLAIA